MFCQWLCRDLDSYCSIERDCKLSDLDPYEHLKRTFKLCTVHFKRHINDLRHQLPSDVLDAMLSLSTTKQLRDLNGVFEKIRMGGKKASGLFLDTEKVN